MKNIIQISKSFLILVLVLSFLFLVFNFTKKYSQTTENLDTFAKCLTEKGATMFGTYWCPHCKNEKAAFGDSFRYVNYMECTKKVDECIAAQIKGYPTWILADGTKLVGEQGVEKLAEATGCPL